MKMTNLPSTVYKFRSWSDEFHRRIITHRELYFANFRSFMAKEEHDLRFEWKFDKSLLMKKLKIIVDKKHPTYSKREKEVKIKYYFNSFLKEGLENMPRMKQELLDLFDSERGIFSTTINPRNEKIWQVFGNGFEGFALGFDSSFIYDYIDFQAYSSQIEYYDPMSAPSLSINDYLKGNNEKNTWKLIMTLPNKYRAENEYRVTKVICDNERKFILDSKYFKELIIGHKMGRSDRDHMIGIAKNNFPNMMVIEQVYDGISGFDYFKIC